MARNSTTPPHDIEAEESLLGAMLLSPAAIAVALEACDPEDFYRPAHTHIFVAVEALHARAERADPITVMAELSRRGLADGLQSADLLALQTNTPAADAAPYARIVVEKARARQMLSHAAEVTERVMSGDLAGAEASVDGLVELADNGPRRTPLVAPDLGEIMRNPRPQVVPDHLRRQDGRGMVIAGSETLVHGEPGAGKSWMMTEAIRQSLDRHLRVVILDYESNEFAMAERLTELGADPGRASELVMYLRPGSAKLTSVARVTVGFSPTLVVLDGLGAALARHDLDEDKASQVLKLLGTVTRPAADAGAAVVIIDHVTKAREGRGRWGRGSGAKLAEVDVAYTLEVVQPFARGHEGSSTLRVAKDRWGVIGPEGSVAAAVRFTMSLDGRLRVQLEPPSSDIWLGHTRCAQAIIDLLADGAERSGRQLIQQLRDRGDGFNQATVRQAAQELVADPSKAIVSRHEGRAIFYRFDASVASLDLVGGDF